MTEKNTPITNISEKSALVTLVRIGTAIAQVRDVPTLLRTIIDELKPIFGFYDVGLFVVNEAENYHIDLATEMPKISPSKGNQFFFEKHLDKMPHHRSLLDETMQQITEAGQPVIFDFQDFVARYPNYPQWALSEDKIMVLETLGYRDCLAVNLTVQGTLIGMFCLNALQRNHFRSEQFALFQAVADQVAIALSHILAQESVLKEKHKVEQLLSISKAITEIKDRKQLLKTIYKRIQPIFPYDAYGLFVLTQDKQFHYELIDAEVMDHPAQVAIERRYGTHAREPHSNSCIDVMMRQGPGLFLVSDFMDYPQAPLMYEAGLRQVIAGPLTYSGEAIGMLCFNSKQKDHYCEQHLPLFEAISEQLSVAVANVLANEEVLAEKAKVERLHFVSEVMATIQHRDQLKLAFDRIQTVFPFDNAGLFLLDETGGNHYELLDSETLNDDPIQQRLEQQFGKHTRYPHAGSPVEAMMQRGRIGLYDFQEMMASFPDYPQTKALQDSGLRQIIATPLRQGQDVIGLLNFNSQQPDRFSEVDFSFFQAVAEQMSTVVNNILANEREQEEQQFKETLLDITSAVAKIADRDQLIRSIQERLRTSFVFEDSGLFVFTSDRQALEDLMVSYPHISPSPLNVALHQKAQSNQLIPLNEESGMAYTIRCLQENGGITIFNMQEFARKFPAYQQAAVLHAHDYQDSLTALLEAGGQVIGFFCINSFHQNFSKSQFALFRAIADQLAVAVSNVLAQEDIERRERFKTLQVELMRIFELSYELKDNYHQSAHLLQAEIPCDLFVALRFDTSSHQMQGGSYFYANQAESHWLRERALLEGEVTNEQLLRGWCQEVTDGVRYLNGKDFANYLPPHAPIREAYRQMGIRSGLLGKTVLNADSSLLIAYFSYRPDVYGSEHRDLLHRLLPTFQLVTDRSLAHRRVQRLTERLKEENTYLEEEIRLHYNFGEIVGESDVLREAFTQVQQVAPTDSTVLVLGETGTGKELVARAIHEQSPRSKASLIKINCAALPPQLIESELFGHERGAFTGAVQRRIGKFELAHSGTLFLDEVGELPLELQAKLLRVLQEKAFERLGSNQVLKTDARIVAATNRNLEAEVRQGTFRADLFYRLNVFPIHLPPLRQRTGDIPLLAQHFVNRYARKFKKPFVKHVSASTLQAFHRWSFPGNVRELEHLIERAVILAKQAEITVDLPLATALPGLIVDGGEFNTLRDNERHLILRVLDYTHGKVRGPGGAAAILDIKPTTLESRMERLGIQKRLQFR